MNHPAALLQGIQFSKRLSSTFTGWVIFIHLARLEDYRSPSL